MIRVRLGLIWRNLWIKWVKIIIDLRELNVIVSDHQCKQLAVKIMSDSPQFVQLKDKVETYERRRQKGNGVPYSGYCGKSMYELKIAQRVKCATANPLAFVLICREITRIQVVRQQSSSRPRHSNFLNLPQPYSMEAHTAEITM